MTSDRRQIRAAIAAVLLSALGIGAISVGMQRAITAGEVRRVDRITRELVDANDLRLHIERKAAWVRAYVATGDASYLPKVAEADHAVRAALTRLAENGADGLSNVVRLTTEHHSAVASAIHSRQRGDTPDEVELFAGSEARTHQLELDGALRDFVRVREQELATARARASRAEAVAVVLNIAITATALALAGLVVLLLTRMLRLERERSREAEEANRELDAFAGRIAHDLRNALSPAVYAVGCLREGKDPEAARFGAVIERVLVRANGMIEGLLAFARTTAQQSPADSAARLQVAVRDVAEELAGPIEKHGVALDVSVDDSAVRCSPGLLHVMLANLVGNAVKFLEGRPTRRVRVNGRAHGDVVEIVVEDTGPGIPPASLGRIFDPFYRVPGVKVSGSGIGLATVKRVVEAHGGSIDVRSTVGTGTTFRLRLPRAITPKQDSPTHAPAEARG